MLRQAATPTQKPNDSEYKRTLKNFKRNTGTNSDSTQREFLIEVNNYSLSLVL